MEVPTTAAYVICVSVAGLALTTLGLEPLQAHLFVFWFALLSTITPPVCDMSSSPPEWRKRTGCVSR